MDDEGAERLPPHSKDAEAAVIGSILRLNSVLHELTLKLKADDFYIYAHQEIYRAILELYEQGKPADVMTVSGVLLAKKKLDDAGGTVYFHDLFTAAPNPANANYYADIVRKMSVYRALIQIGTDIAKDSWDKVDSPEALVESAERKVFALSQNQNRVHTVTMAEAVFEATDRLEVRIDVARGKSNATAGLMTGWQDLDMLTCGLRNQELVVIGARPGVGKTAVAMNLVHHFGVANKQPILVISLEQAAPELAERSVCIMSDLGAIRVRGGTITDDELERWIFARDILAEKKIHFAATPSQTMMQISATARRMKAKHGIVAVLIDYIQLIEPENPRSPRHEQVSSMSRRLKLLARELDVPVIALAQLNRQSEARQDTIPKLSDLRESGAIEQDADAVFLLHQRPPEPGQQMFIDILDVYIGKQRNGPTGKIPLLFNKTTGKIGNYAPIGGGQ